MLLSSLSSSESVHPDWSETLTTFKFSKRSLKDATMSPLFSWSCGKTHTEKNAMFNAFKFKKGQPLKARVSAYKSHFRIGYHCANIRFRFPKMQHEALCMVAELVLRSSWRHYSCSTREKMKETDEAAQT